MLKALGVGWLIEQLAAKRSSVNSPSSISQYVLVEEHFHAVHRES